MSTETGTAPDGRPMVQPASRTEWRAWLAQNHTESTGIWLASFKARSGKPRLSYEDIVEEALCFGWIDSKGNKLDDERSLLWCSPRNPRSAWSGLNKVRIEKLIGAGLMQPAGLRSVELAQANGGWSALDEVERLVVPADLQAAFAEYPQSESNWHSFSRSVKRGVLEWIGQAKRPETRGRRIAETARLAAENQPANQWRPKSN